MGSIYLLQIPSVRREMRINFGNKVNTEKNRKSTKVIRFIDIFRFWYEQANKIGNEVEFSLRDFVSD